MCKWKGSKRKENLTSGIIEFEANNQLKGDSPCPILQQKLITTLIDKGDITESFRSHVEEAVNKLLQIELTEILNYDRYDRSIKTEHGELSICVPRDRNGEFSNQTITPYKRHNDTLESTIIQLYTNGLTTEEIHASIYTTNLIEGFNKHLKRYTKRKEQFPSEDSLSRFIHSRADRYNQKFMIKVHKGFGLVTSEWLDRFSK